MLILSVSSSSCSLYDWSPEVYTGPYSLYQSQQVISRLQYVQSLQASAGHVCCTLVPTISTSRSRSSVVCTSQHSLYHYKQVLSGLH